MGETFSWQPFFVVRFGVHHLHVYALSILMIEQCVVYLMVLYLRSFLSFFFVCVCCQQLFLLQRKYEDGVACWVYIVSSSIHTLFGSLFPLLCMHDHSNFSPAYLFPHTSTYPFSYTVVSRVIPNTPRFHASMLLWAIPL